MFRSQLRAEVLVANFEHTLPIPLRTQNVRFSTRSEFPIRVSFSAGEVAAANPQGFIVSDGEDTLKIGPFDGPIYYASDQPHALMDVVCTATKV